MKKEFSTTWKASKQPRKQRKYIAKAPLHIKRKFVGTNLSKELRKKYETRNLPVRKGDIVRVMRGKFKKKQGKVLEVSLKKKRVAIEGVLTKKQDGSKVNVFLRPSILQIVELHLEDKKRLKNKKIAENKMEKSEKAKVNENKSKENKK